MYYYLNCFFIYAILGHLLESVVYLFETGESGVLFGLWTPIYGIGATILIFLDRFLLEKRKWNPFIKAFLIFLNGAIILSFIEYLGGLLIESIFQVEFWNYTGLKYHIGKYAALEMSFIWGIGSLVVIYVLKPVMDCFIKKIPKILTWILLFFLFLDGISTILFKVILV